MTSGGTIPTPYGLDRKQTRRFHPGLFLIFALALSSLFFWSCNTKVDDEYTVTFKLDSARVGKFDSVRVEIYNGAAPGPGDTAKPVQVKTLAISPTTAEVSIQLSSKVKKDFSAVVTGFSGGDIAYRNLHTIDGFKAPDSTKPSVLLVSRIQTEDLTLSVGETRLPALTLTPANAGDKRILLFSEDSEIAKVSGDSLSGVKVGKVKVTATTADMGIKVDFSVSVVGVRVSELKSESLSLKIGDTAKPAVTVLPANVTDKEFSLESTDSTLLSVSGKSVKALKAGKVKLILISRDGGSIDTVSVDVRLAVTGLTGKELVREAGDTFAPVLEWVPIEATHQTYTLESKDSNTVAVRGDSLLAKAMGAVKITVTSKDGGFTDEFEVKVQARVFPVKGVATSGLRALLRDTLEPKVTFDPANASDKGFTLRSLDTALAGIVDNMVAAKDLGTVKIELTTVDGGIKDTFSVSIQPSNFVADIRPITSSKCSPCHVPPATFNWTDSAQLVRKGSVAMFRLTLPDTTVGHMPVKGADGGPITPRQLRVLLEWLSRITIPLGSVSVSDISANMGDTLTPVVVFTPANASNKEYRLVSLDTTIVVVRGKSLVAVDAGTVTIDLKTDEGPMHSKFKVTAALPSFTKNVLPITMGKCTPCHGPNQVFNWQDSTALIADGSNALDRLQRAPNAPGKMPLKGAQNGDITPLELKILLAWLNSKVVPLKDITVPNDSVFLGRKKKPVIDWFPANASNKSFILVSTDTAKVGVLGNEFGGKSLGSATVEVRTIDGDISKFVTVKVLPIKVDSLSLNDTGCAKNDSVHLKAVFFPVDATNQAYTVASVSQGGTKVKIDSGTKITALTLGKDTLEATTADGSKKARFVFTVGPVLPTSLTIPDANGKVNGTAFSLALTWNPATTTNKSVTLAITGDTANVAAARGTALAPTILPKTTTGQVTVTATSVANPTVKATFKFTVGTVSVTSFTVSPTTAYDAQTLSPIIKWDPINATNQNFTLVLPVGDTGLALTGGGTTLLTKKVGSRVVTVRSLDSNKTAPWTMDVIRTSFTANISGIVTKKCAVCHNEGTAPQPNWKDSTTFVLYGDQIKDRISQVAGSIGHMPQGGTMKADTIAIITKWLNQ